MRGALDGIFALVDFLRAFLEEGRPNLSCRERVLLFVFRFTY
jgi:hypothetical protein